MNLEPETVYGWSERWPAPAKLNLMLRIVGRRGDGYHLLQTVFQFVDFCDWLTFEPMENGLIQLANPIPGVPEQDDLTVRAARLLQQSTDVQHGVRIGIEKNLPMGGGLGGGSSDAATTLLVLNYLWQLNLTVEQLMQLGVKLGADVPVFVFGSNAWAEGVGEKLQCLDVPESWFVVLKPDCHVDTGEVFRKENLTRDSKCIRIRDFTSGAIQNDCQAVVLEMYPEVVEAWDAMSQYGEVRLTGSGACIFVQFENKVEAEPVYHALKDNWQVYLTQGLDGSPVVKQLTQIKSKL